MSSTKRIRPELSTTATHVPPPDTAAGMTQANTIATRLYAFMHAPQAEASSLTLATIPLELFILIAFRLSAADVVNLSQTASYFHQALSARPDGPSLLQRSLNLVRHKKSYDEHTQTLDLRAVIFKSSDSATVGYKEYLRGIKVFLGSHQIWAITHIQTLVIPMEMIIRWKLSDILSNIISYLPGVTHLHLFLSSALQPPLNKSNLNRLFENLNALKTIPVHKVTIENRACTGIFTDILFYSLAHGFFHPGIRHLSITNNTSREVHTYHMALPDNPAYSQLDTFDFSGSRPGILQINRLPTTITCLRISSITHIKGRASGVEKLEILGSQSAGTGNFEYLAQSIKALPALKTIYIEPPLEHTYHSQILQTLTSLPPSDLSIIFSALHVHRIDVLEKLRAVFHGGVFLPEELIFHFCTPESINDFISLASQGGLRALAKIGYQIDSVFTPVLPFFSALITLLETGKLPHLAHFTLAYQYNPLVPEGKPGAPFLQSPEGKLLLMQSPIQLTLRDILKHENCHALLSDFITIEKQLSEQLSRDNIQPQQILAGSRRILAEVIETYEYLTTQAYTAIEWQFHLEKLYLTLYNAYIRHLRWADVPPQALLACQQSLPQTVFDTAAGQQLNLNIQTVLLSKEAEKIYLNLRSKFTGHGLIQYAITAGATDFSIDFTWQGGRQTTPHQVM